MNSLKFVIPKLRDVFKFNLYYLCSTNLREYPIRNGFLARAHMRNKTNEHPKLSKRIFKTGILIETGKSWKLVLVVNLKNYNFPSTPSPNTPFTSYNKLVSFCKEAKSIFKNSL
jgi:hypothetical protein